jgi:fumarate reductase (CoM/CoB) subunit B
MDVLNQLRSGKLEWTQENAAPMWACTGCRQCTNFCNHDNEPGLVLLAGRAQANARGAGHPTLQNYAERFQKRETRLAKKLREHLPDHQRTTDAEIGFWPGCDAIGKGIADIDAALQLFDNMGGEKVRVVESEQVCGGYPLLAAGYPDMFRWHAQRVADSLRPFKKIITNCSACIFTMRRQFAAEGVELEAEIVSVSEYLVERITALPRNTEKRPVYYHDPCHLARYSGIIEEPRMVLSRIAELRDFDWSHSDTECCGGAGLLPKTDPDTADSMARRRLREVANRGGGTVVTACATCTYMLKSNASSKVRVVDLATYVVEACRKPESSPS